MSYQKVNCFDLERVSSRLAQEKIYEFTFVKEKAQLLKIKHNAKISLYPTQNTIISSYQKVNCFDLERMSSRLAQEKIYEFTFVNEQILDKHNAEIVLSRQNLLEVLWDNTHRNRNHLMSIRSIKIAVNF
ncbi:MAG: hypothetical protein ACI8ZM_002260 [Crocinitomix sp.]